MPDQAQCLQRDHRKHAGHEVQNNAAQEGGCNRSQHDVPALKMKLCRIGLAVFFNGIHRFLDMRIRIFIGEAQQDFAIGRNHVRGTV